MAQNTAFEARSSVPAPLANTAAVRFFYRAIVGRKFHRYFDAVSVESDQLRHEVYRIRYDVYCSELGWENVDRFPESEEYDAHDANALHCLLHYKPRNEYAGCVRVVRLPDDDPQARFPFELACADTLSVEGRRLLDKDRRHCGEISRLAVRSQFRRRRGESQTAAGIEYAEQPVPGAAPTGESRGGPHIAICLYLAAACRAMQLGMTGAFALMEPRLCARLGKYGIKFLQIGDPIEHRGLRAPFYISKSDLHGGLTPKLRALLEVVDEDLRKSRG